MHNFALSRRQRGFESRWGHKFEPTLTRSNASFSCAACTHELRERAGNRTVAAALQRRLQQLRSKTFGSLPCLVQVARSELQARLIGLVRHDLPWTQPNAQLG
jgi:hypothetical protein